MGPRAKSPGPRQEDSERGSDLVGTAVLTGIFFGFASVGLGAPGTTISSTPLTYCALILSGGVPRRQWDVALERAFESLRAVVVPVLDLRRILPLAPPHRPGSERVVASPDRQLGRPPAAKRPNGCPRCERPGRQAPTGPEISARRRVCRSC